jgi:hypothetical protein
VPLIVIFTKRDGAVTKFTSEIISSTPGGPESRGLKKEARRRAENSIDAYIKSREGDLKQLSYNDVSVVFLTMSGMFCLANAC